MNAPLYGLILTGGKSSRMGQNKSQLEMRPGISQLDYLWQLLQTLVDQSYVSVAHGAQKHACYDSLVDQEHDQGPLGGICTALSTHSHCAFLVVACDLPLLTKETLESLIVERDQNEAVDVTCYLNPHDNRPEPLCAIYEPSALPILQKQLDQDKYCARKMVESSTFLGLNLEHSYALNNANTPYDLSEAQLFLQQAPMEKNIDIHYFAQLKAQAGKAQESHQTYAATAAGLYDELKMKHHFSFKLNQLKVAINDAFCPWDTALNSNDKVVFMPPVTGG